MSERTLQVLLSSWPDEEALVAEIWFGDDYIGDVRKRNSELVVNLNTSGLASSVLPLDEIERAMVTARARLKK